MSRIKPERYLRENFLSHFDAGERDALDGKPRAHTLTPSNFFNVGVKDYTNGYNAGLRELATKDTQ